MSTAVDLCTPLPMEHRLEDPKGEAFTQQYFDVIVDAIIRSDRSIQTSLGPSEIGDPCTRRIGFKLLGMPENDLRPNWKATVGTGTHMWLETAFDRYNLANALHYNGQERFYIETRVNVGLDINGAELSGSCDLYDRVTGTVVDHKTCGPTMLNKYRKKGPGQQYRVQAHLYGRGWQRAGLPVTRVMIVFLPRQGELDDAYIWSEPYDEQVAIDALQRLAGVQAAVNLLGFEALEPLPTVEAYCTSCPFFRHKSTDLTKGCPGDPASNINKPISAIDQSAPFGAVYSTQPQEALL